MRSFACTAVVLASLVQISRCLDALTYTTDASGSRTSGCHSGSRCVNNLNDGNVQKSSHNDWLVNGVSAGNVASRMWTILDLGGSNTACVGAVGVWNQNEYGDSHRQVTSFDLQAGHTVGGAFTTILSGATIAIAGNANPNPERYFEVQNCVVKRYIKFIGKGVHNTDGYAGIMELKLYRSASGCCHVPGHCEWRGAFVMLDNYYCCPSGGHAISDSSTQLGAGIETRTTLVADAAYDTFTCNCGTAQVCTHTPSPQGHVTMLPTTTSATRKLS